jgi:hypothetical protein
MFHIVGENPESLKKWHRVTINRTRAFAIAIHIPVMLWALTGYVISSTIFALETMPSIVVSVFCSLLIYLIERIIIATPQKKWYVNLTRFLIGIVMAILGASAVDLVIFDREVSYQLKKNEQIRIINDFDGQINQKTQILKIKKDDWLKAQSAANCEANGECGSKTKKLGPIYQALKNQANLLHDDYAKEQSQLEILNEEKEHALVSARKNIIGESGVLARIQALHNYTTENIAALVVYALFFSLILFFELMVVLTKLVFGETVDDRIEKAREVLTENKVKTYQETMSSQFYGVRNLILNAY